MSLFLSRSLRELDKGFLRERLDLISMTGHWSTRTKLRLFEL